jgi:hypothetical protein
MADVGDSVEWPPTAPAVGALEDARTVVLREREHGPGMLWIEHELADVAAFEAGRKPPPSGVSLGGRCHSGQRWLGASLRAGGAAAVVEAVEAEQADGGGHERAGGVSAPPPPRPLARLLDQRLERLDVGGTVDPGRPWPCESAHRDR